MAYSVTQSNADLLTVAQQILRTAGEQIRVALPCIIESYNADAQTVTAQPAIKEKLNRNGVITQVQIPPLVDVPIVLPYAGGYGLFIAPQKGDECLVVFSDMCIDSWWQSGGVQTQADTRRHDLSDAFAVLGCWSQPNKPVMPLNGLRIGSKDGVEYLAINDKTAFIAAPKGLHVGAGTHSGTEAEPRFEVGDKSVFNGYVTFNGGTNLQPPIFDSGWQDLTLTSAFEAWGTSDLPQYRKYGSMVFLRGAVRTKSQFAAGSYTVISTMPSGYYSTVRRLQMPVLLATNGYSQNGALYLDNVSGNLQYRHLYTSALAAGNYISICGSYMVDD